MKFALKYTPLPVALTLLGIICPVELSVYIGSLRLPPHRIALIIFTVFALVRFVTRGPMRIRSYDLLFALYAFWTIAIFIQHEGFGDGLEFGGSLALESFGAYFIARVYVRDERTFLATMQFVFGCMVLVALIALPEFVFGQHFVHEWLHKLTGHYHPIGYETRLGLTRAYSTFDHPILYGSFCASMMAVFWFTERGWFKRLGRTGTIGGAAILGLSSAPLLSLMVQGAIIGWEFVSRGTAGRIGITLVAIVGLYIGFDLITSRPAIEVIVTKITLDPWTAYYRLLIWRHGLETVANSPWVGIGLSDWSRAWWMASGSVDAYWLVIMMRAGIPALVLHVLAIVMLWWAIARRTTALPPSVRRLVKGWTISFLALALVGFTVHYWNTVHAYIFFFLGAGTWFAEARFQKYAVKRKQRVAAASPIRPVVGAVPVGA